MTWGKEEEVETQLCSGNPAGITECRLEKAFFGLPVRRADLHIKVQKQYNKSL